MKKIISLLLTILVLIPSIKITNAEPKVYQSEFLPKGKFIFTTYGYHDTWTNEWKGWGDDLSIYF